MRVRPLSPLLLLTLALLFSCRSATTPTRTTITILHFSDYHSHAVPFHVDGEDETAGIARAVAYVEPLASRDDVLVFNGGDTMNLGAPAWSDKYRCIEWSWWNGIVDAMAFGNHDADYGAAVFDECRASIDYPILGANVHDATGKPVFPAYAVFERSGVRVGAFALAGSDFSTLIRPATAPVEGVRFGERAGAAAEVVRHLRDVERVDAVVLIGHASTDEDIALARSVGGIDLILGTHSHVVQPLQIIEGTDTAMISSGQYLSNLSRVELRFLDGRLTDVSGKIVTMSPALRQDARVAERVQVLQKQLEHDPIYAPLFREIATLARGLSNSNVNSSQTELGQFTMEAVRLAADADVALSTSSSFRGSLPRGVVRETDLRDVLPYDNAVVRIELSGVELTNLLRHAASLRGADSFAQIAGASLDLGPQGDLRGISVAGRPINPSETYIVATTDYLMNIAPTYRSALSGKTAEDTGLKVRDIVRTALARL